MNAPLNPTPSFFSPRGFFRAGLVLLLAVAGVAFAAERKVTINLPAKVPAKSPLTVSVAASTDHGQGEQIGFMHAEYSVDSGKTWKALTYVTNVGAKTEHGATFETGPAGSKVVVRVRTAFRGGKAGDVDVEGKAIDWTKGWNSWAEPPTRVATATVE